jgi:heme/copper-type cytochrome/quinol oxidase subunit 4
MKGVGPMLVLVVAVIVQMARHGLTTRYIVLAGATSLSCVALVIYAISVALQLGRTPRRSLTNMVLAFSGFIPYLFGCYLFLYEGLWRLTRLRAGFSASTILLAVAFVVGGYWVVAGTHAVSEAAKFQRISSVPSAASSPASDM